MTPSFDAFDLIFTRLRRGSSAVRGEEIRICETCSRHYQASTGREEACSRCADAACERAARPASLFVCDRCLSIENTAAAGFGGYWGRKVFEGRG